MRGRTKVAIVAAWLLVAAGVTALIVVLARVQERQEVWWRDMKPSCRLLTVVSGKAFGPPYAVYECPGGVLVKRNIGD